MKECVLLSVSPEEAIAVLNGVKKMLLQHRKLDKCEGKTVWLYCRNARRRVIINGANICGKVIGYFFCDHVYAYDKSEAELDFIASQTNLTKSLAENKFDIFNSFNGGVYGVHITGFYSFEEWKNVSDGFLKHEDIKAIENCSERKASYSVFGGKEYICKKTNIPCSRCIHTEMFRVSSGAIAVFTDVEYRTAEGRLYSSLLDLKRSADEFINNTHRLLTLSGGSIKKHLAAMRWYYAELPEKPLWISEEDIDRYEVLMKDIVAREGWLCEL